MKNILVSLNDHDMRKPLSAFAAALAQRHGSHLSGLYVVPALRLYPVVTVHVPPDVFEAQRKVFRKRGEEVHAAFREACEEHGVECEWHLLESLTPLVADTVIGMSRVQDLVITGQPPEEESPDLEADFADRLVMETGRPVLFVPRHGAAEPAFDHVVVGWNCTREAARALHDALPLLKGAGKVEMVWVDPPEETGARRRPLEDVVAALQRHGIAAEGRGISSDGHHDPGAALLAYATDAGADLMVMGAWGHSRLREYVFGGVTQTVLTHMTVPVLFSH